MLSMLRLGIVIALGCISFAGSVATPLVHAEGPQPKHLLSWGQKGDKPGEFYSPISIFINAKDEVYVTDLNNSRLQKFTSDGKYISGFDFPLDAPPRKSCILGGMAVDEGGQIYVSFMVQHKVAVYSEKGEVIREWGKKGTAEGEFHQPGGIVLHPDGTLYVADQCNHRVQHFTREGKFLGTWGKYGTEPGEFGGMEPAGSRFAGPHFLTLDSHGHFYTTEGVMGRVQQLSVEGKPLLAWGNKSDEPGGFGEYNFGNLKNTFGPIGVFADKHNRIWVSSLNNRVQAFTPEGKFLFGIMESGDKPGQLDHPHGMAMDSQGHLYIADSGNQRIQKFEIPAP